MYNEYLQQAAPPASEAPCSQTGGGLLQLLTERLGGAKLDADTLVAIAVIWFLLSDGQVLDTELLIIIGVLLLLGI